MNRLRCHFGLGGGGRNRVSPSNDVLVGGAQWAGTGQYGVPADAISVPTDSASEIVKFTILIPHESCTNAKAKYSSSVVPPEPSVHFYHCPIVSVSSLSL